MVDWQQINTTQIDWVDETNFSVLLNAYCTNKNNIKRIIISVFWKPNDSYWIVIGNFYIAPLRLLNIDMVSYQWFKISLNVKSDTYILPSLPRFKKYIWHQNTNPNDFVQIIIKWKYVVAVFLRGCGFATKNAISSKYRRAGYHCEKNLSLCILCSQYWHFPWKIC